MSDDKEVIMIKNASKANAKQYVPFVTRAKTIVDTF